MPMPVRSLPVLQNWDCQGCSACCRGYHVHVSPAERARIEAQGWETEPGFADVPLFVRDGNLLTDRRYRLNRVNEACVFLDPDNRCRIHAKFGLEAKPLACRVYPYLLVPAGDHWRLGLRFACPSAAASAGRPLADHLAEARGFAAEVEAGGEAVPADAPPPPLQGRQFAPWADLFRFAAAVSAVLGDTSESLERRWRTVLALVGVCRAATFDGNGDPAKAVTGTRLKEFLAVVGPAVGEEVPAAADVPPPGWVGRMVFRPTVAYFARKDIGPDRGTAQRGPVGRVLAAARFARGRGRVPRVHLAIPAGARFADAERPAGPLPPEADALLTRYYRLKAESLQFCGPSNFGMPFWDGLESLALTFPAVMWLGRVLSGGGTLKPDAVTEAVRIVDDNFGFNKLLGAGRQRYALRLLAGRGELAKLVAWYGR